MFSVKHLVAAITLGTAMLMAPSAVTAKPVRHHTTSTTHVVKHKKKAHKRVHRKHSKKTSAKHAKSKHVVAHATRKHRAVASTSKHKKVAASHKTGSRHHPNL